MSDPKNSISRLGGASESPEDAILADRFARIRAKRGGRKRLLQQDQAQVLSAGRTRRCAVDLYGAARQAAAAAGVGVRAGAGRAELHVEANTGIELAAGDGRRHRFQPRLVPASRRSEFRSAVQGLQGQSVQSARLKAGV